MKFKKRGPPLALLLLGVVLALGSLGVAYGLWSKTLTIDGTVNTGNVDAVWFYASCAEDPPEVEGKDVGSFTVAPDPNDQEILLFTINNGYPGYGVDCEVHFANNGSIPVKVQSITEDDPNGDAVIEVLLDGIGSQLEPCGSTPAWGTPPHTVPANCQSAMSLIAHVQQEAQQSSTYQFGFGVCLRQWNEVGSCP